MITITRLLAKTVGSLFKKGLHLRGGSFALRQPIELLAGPHGLTIRTQTSEHAVEYHQSGSLPEEQLLVPLQLFKDVAGTKPEELVFKSAKENRIAAHWQDGAVPRSRTVDAPELPSEPRPFPGPPDNLLAMEPGFLGALHDAVGITDRESSRYALGCVQLRKDGAIVATDGRQAYRHNGFQFPFKEDLLLPANSVFGSPELDAEQTVLLGSTERHVVIQVGPWTFYRRLGEGRFPRVDDVIPAVSSARTIVELDPGDREFLVSNLRRLPAASEDYSPVTVELNGSVLVRAKGADDRTPTELILSNSRNLAEDDAFAINRAYLEQAARFRLPRLCTFGNNSPILCHDDRRDFLWMRLDATCAVPSGDNAIRIESSPARRAPTRATNKPSRNFSMAKRKTIPVPEQAPATDSPAETSAPAPATQPKTIEQAIRLHGSLRDALRATGDLVRALKRQKKQERAFKATLASLRQLQNVA